MARITQEEKEMTKRRILDCAKKLFSEKGIKNSSIREIAKLANVGASTVYGYYPSKVEMFLEATLPDQAIKFQMLESVEQMNFSGLGRAETLQFMTDLAFNMAGSVFDFSHATLREIHAVLFMMESEEEISRITQIIGMNQMNQISAIFEGLIIRMIQAGILKPETKTDRLAKLIVDTFRMAVTDYTYMLNASKADGRVYFEEMLETIFDGKWR